MLGVILPSIAPEEYFDDRLADTLDAIFDYGIGNLETLITQRMISEFNIENDLCHNDTTSASVYGECGNNKTAHSIKIGFGYSKKHRQDLKQLVWSLSVSSDSAFPLFQKAYSGNTAIANTKTAFKELGRKLNKYRLKTEEAIDKACASILKKYYTTDFFEYSIKNEPLITYKNKKKRTTGKEQKTRQNRCQHGSFQRWIKV